MRVTYGGFDMGFGVAEMVFVIVIGIFVVIAWKGISTWNKNNHSPQLSVPAVVAAKRTEVTHHRHPNAGDITGAHGYSTTISTRHYVTFQAESGEQMEFAVTGSQYGELAERDAGQLSFQGTRYLSFERSADV